MASVHRLVERLFEMPFEPQQREITLAMVDQPYCGTHKWSFAVSRYDFRRPGSIEFFHGVCAMPAFAGELCKRWYTLCLTTSEMPMEHSTESEAKHEQLPQYGELRPATSHPDDPPRP